MEQKTDYFTAKKELTSDFNEAKLQIFRMNNSWEGFSRSIKSGELIKANWELDDIWGELSVDAENIDEGKDTVKTFHHKIDKINWLIAHHKIDPTKLYFLLRKKEKVLRRLQDASGKGSKRSDRDEDDIDT